MQTNFLRDCTDMLATYVERDGNSTPVHLSEAFWCLCQLLQLSYSAIEPYDFLFY